MNNQQEQVPVVPVEIKAFSLEEATEILKTNDPTSLPQWQLHGSVLVVNNEIKQVMIKVDRYKEPTIVVPKPYIVR